MRLNGIPLQFLDGTEDDTARMQAVMSAAAMSARRDRTRELAIQAATAGLTDETLGEIDTVGTGYDFAGFGDDDTADDEMLRNYLERTKRTMDAATATMAGHSTGAREYTQLLGHVLSRWDTADREEAIDTAAAREDALIEAGQIDAGMAGDDGAVGLEQVYDVDAYTNSDGTVRGMYSTAVAQTDGKRKGFFSKLKKAMGNKRLTSEAKELVAVNPATTKRRLSQRQILARSRRTLTKNVTDTTGKTKKITQSVATAHQSVNGTGDELDSLMRGDGLDYGIEGMGADQATGRIRNYLERTRDVIATRPLECFDSRDEALAHVAALDTLLRSWGNERLRAAVLDSMESGALVDGLGSLNGRLRKKLKKAVKKVGKAVKKATKTVAKAVKKVGSKFKKLGKAIAKVAKKAWKIIVRFNPLTFLIRAGILAVCRLNMFKISNKCYPGTLTKEEALKKGISADEWEKSHKSYGHLAKAYTAIGGKESKLRKVLEKGNKKKWTGTEYPTDGASIKAAAAATPETAEEAQEGKDEQAEAQAEMKAKGAVADSTARIDVASETKKVEVTIIENERTAKSATPLRETGETTGKVLVTIPKGGKVTVDTAQGDSTWIAATYGTHTGWIQRTSLAGLGDTVTAEDVLLCGLSGLYEEGEMTAGLGCDPATGASITAATSTIAAIMAKIKNIFGVAQKVKEGVDTAKNLKDGIKSKDAGKVLSAAGSAASMASGGDNAFSQTVSQAQSVYQTGKGYADTAKAYTSAARSTVQAARPAAQPQTQPAAQATSKGRQTVAAQPQRQAAQQAYSQAAPQTQKASQPAAAMPNPNSGSGNTGLFVGLGVGALVLGGVGYLILHKKN